MAYKIISTDNEISAEKARSNFLSEWRSQDKYFLNRRDSLAFSNIRTVRDIILMKYEISKETIYSNHYDGIVFIDLSHITEIRNTNAVSNLINYISEESRYADFFITVTSSINSNAEEIARALEAMLTRQDQITGGIR